VVVHFRPFQREGLFALRAFRVIALLSLFSACGTQINTLRSVASHTTEGASGVPPAMTSLTITDASPTRSTPLTIAWGLEVGTHTDYCLLENSVDSSICIWHSGTLPTTYTDSSLDGPFVLDLPG
jgi:hypothetical protein